MAAALFAKVSPHPTKGQIFRVSGGPIFAPGLAQASLKPDRVIYWEAGDETATLACIEEALHYGGLGA